MRWSAMCLLSCLPSAAWAIPTPLPYPILPPVLPGISVGLTPYTTIPPEAGRTSAPLAQIQYATPARDGTGALFVNDLKGIIYRTTPGSSPAPWLDITTALGAGAAATPGLTHGLQALAFHPNYAGDPSQPGYGKFYTSANGPAGSATIGSNDPGKLQAVVTEWTTNPKAATYTPVAPPRTVIQIGGYSDEHSNGLIAFNPTAAPGTPDYGRLYIGSGDGNYNDADRNAQNLGVPQGKMLRINPLQAGASPYSVPADNPFLKTKGALPEIWATGLRYPQSFSWDLGTGAMYINDLGQAEIEEVNRGIAGANYGWSQREGTFATGYAYGLSSDNELLYPVTPDALPGGPYTDPLAMLEHLDGALFALGSGFVYRGQSIPALQGKYVLEDIVSGAAYYFDPQAGDQAQMYSLDLTINGATISLNDQFGYGSNPFRRVDARVSQDEGGELYIGLKSTGEIFQLRAAAVPEPASLILLGSAAALGLATRRRAAR